MPCTTGCPTQDHATWGECVRSKRVVTGTATHTAYQTGVAEHDADMDAYAALRKDGVQPPRVGGSRERIRRESVEAVEADDRLGLVGNRT